MLLFKEEYYAAILIQAVAHLDVFNEETIN